MIKLLNLFLALLLTASVAGITGCRSRGAANGAVDESGRPTNAGKDLPNEPDVTFKDLQGKDVPLSSFKGKVVVVNFWATWCEPCRVEIPWMIDFQQKLGDKGFTLLGVAMDEEGKSVVEPFVQKTQFDVDGQNMTMNYPIVLGNDDLAAKFGGLIGLPTSVVISRDGKVAKRFIGLVSHEQLAKTIQGLLQPTT
jgi:thiol-disulfide isomerase/thioredoxin